jgi:hypothetical protein
LAWGDIEQPLVRPAGGSVATGKKETPELTPGVSREISW